MEHLHKHGYIYRDLKPENIFHCRKNGLLKLGDFGFIKHLKKGERAYTLCGTPEYLAPEVLLGSGYSYASDWWSFGILMYEMIMGRPPFKFDGSQDMDPLQHYKNIIQGTFQLNNITDPLARHLIKNLCHPDQSYRYGNNMADDGGVEQIKKHKFFNLDWKVIE